MVGESTRSDQLDTVSASATSRLRNVSGPAHGHQADAARSPNRSAALKVLGPALTQGSDLARFQREAQAAARLHHPSIATLFFVGQDGDLCYHVMELIQGTSLRRVIDRLTATIDSTGGPDSAVTAELSEQPVAPAVRFDQPTTT